MKCSTRHDATASMGVQAVPASACATSFMRLGMASFSVSALASSWATRASEGDPEKTVCAAPAAPKVQPVPAPLPGMTPHCVAVSPSVQLQVGPGSTPEASTSATSAAMGAFVGTGAAGVDAGAGAVGAVVVVVGAGVVVMVEALAGGVTALGARSAGRLCTGAAAPAGGVDARAACVPPSRPS